MPTNREIYFSQIKKNNKYLIKNVVESLLMEANNFSTSFELFNKLDDECKNIDWLYKAIDNVQNGIPYQYVLGYCYFNNRKYFVDNNVLIPRQETEGLVKRAIQIIKNNFDKGFVCADLGTGSGIIAIEIKNAFKSANVLAIDISEKALQIANKNAELNKTEVSFLKGDMVDLLVKNKIKLDLLISNPPYIKSKDTIDEQTWTYEPHDALLASPSTYFYEKIIKNAANIMNDNYMMFFEIGEDMVEQLKVIINRYLPKCYYIFEKDIYDKDRYLYLTNYGKF